MLHVEHGRKFAKQAERCRRRGKDLGKLKEIVRKLANGEPLEKKHYNHYFENRRVWECHIEPDWLLIYRIRFVRRAFSGLSYGYSLMDL